MLWVRAIANLQKRIGGSTSGKVAFILSLLMVTLPAPCLCREAPAAQSDLRWGKSITLFNGKDFTGWEFSDPRLAGSWKVEQGMLVSSGRGSNLLTARKFGDFKLHIEFNCAPKSNSGVYVVDRFTDTKWLEVQIETDSEQERPSHHTGAIYARLAPSPELPRRAGVWQSFDITLVGRTITVVQNGQTVIDRKKIPGNKGQALDTREMPGPLYLQGSEDGRVAFRNIVITPGQDFEKSKSQTQNDFGQLPLTFEANQGQSDARVRFLARGVGYTVFLADDEAVLAFEKPRPGIDRSRTLRPCGNPGPLWFSSVHAGPWSGLARYWRSLGQLLMPDLDSFSCEPNTSKPGMRAGLKTPARRILRMRLERSDPRTRIVGMGELPGRNNYFIGSDPAKWRTNVPSYSKVKYQGVYPGIDLIFYGNRRRLEYDLVVAPGSDPRQIELSFTGADGMRVDASCGDLVLRVGDDEVRFHKPAVSQPVLQRSRFSADLPTDSGSGTGQLSGATRRKLRARNQESVDGEFVLESHNRVAFGLPAYDHKRELVIDPVLSYSSYLGGSGYESGHAIAVDGAGDAYVTGDTASADFPIAEPLQPQFGAGGSDVFVAKLNAAGSALVYSTYLGGSASSWGTGIAVDSAGNAYLVGNTTSTDFPTVKPIQAANRAGPSARYSAFVAKLNAAGTALEYSTYLGGSVENWGYGIAVDASGSAYVTGSTLSVDFPTASPFQAINKATPKTDTVTAFVAKLDPGGSAFTYSTYLGGSDGDSGQSIAVDSSGDAFITGYTSSDDFPTANALQPSSHGDFDAFVTKLNPLGSALVYSTYLGGSGVDYGYGIAVDSSGNAYVTGRTYSTDFAIANPLQASYGGELDAFVAKLNPAGSALVYSTYLGGDRYDEGNGIAADPSGNAYVTGVTYSAGFPTVGALQPTCGGCDSNADAFVAKVNPTGSALVYSTYLGGSGTDYGYGIAVDSSGDAYVTGETSSTDFPVAHPLQPGAHGSSDVFVTKVSPLGAHAVSTVRRTER
jgi:Domain of Unknown Function (DUF1080)/Beta-propeller repeat